jgi:hypothetical protein
VESSLLVRLWESGAAPWVMITLVAIWAITSVAMRLLRMDPKLVDAFTRWRVIGRIVRYSGGTISTQHAKEMLTLLPPEQPFQEGQK